MANVTRKLIIENTKKYLKSLDLSKPVSLASILKGIGISKGVFYYYFKDKDELLYDAIIPDIKQREMEINRQISNLPTFRERLHFMFEFFTNDKFAKHLNGVEKFYIHFFLNDNASKSKTFRHIITRVSKTRKSLILKQIRYYDIKLTKDVNILIDYIVDTMIFYHIYNKKLHSKNPKKEISNFIDTFCRILDNKYDK